MSETVVAESKGEMVNPLTQFNELTTAAVMEQLMLCCGAARWVIRLAARRPFANLDQLRQTADKLWWALEPVDWREAFSHHPKIGDLASLRTKFATTEKWAVSEQGAVRGATEELLTELAAGNAAYEAKFGYIFIVCATGKSAEEMLALLKQRLPNEPAIELRIAAEEQRKIMQLRLTKLLDELRVAPTAQQP